MTNRLMYSYHENEADHTSDETSALIPPNTVLDEVNANRLLQSSQSNFSPSRKSTQYIAAIIVTVGGFIVGTTLAWTSPTTTALENGFYGFPISKDELAWIGSVMPLGAILGSIITATLVDVIGRKNVILVLAIPCIAGWSAMFSANSVVMICIGRFLTGISSGCYCVVVPMYIAEMAEKGIRGSLGTYFQLQITIGVFVVYVIGSFVNAFTLTFLCGLVPFVYLLLMYILPETPYFHLKKRNIADAQKSLAWFRGSYYDGRHELAVMQRAIEDDETEKIPCLHAFQTRPARLGLIIGFGVMFFQQFSGANAVIFYTKSIFEEAGSKLDANMSMIVVGAAQAISTWVASLVVDKLGRRLLLMLSIAVMALCTFTLGLYFYLKDQVHQDVSDIGWLPLLSLSSFVIVFSLGFGPIPWMLLAEIFPSKIKGTACSLVCLFNWACVFVITKLFPVFVKSFGAGIVFWNFTICCCVGIWFVWLLVPETKGKTLLEVQEMLSRR